MIFGRQVDSVAAAAGSLLNLAILLAKQVDPTGVGAVFTPEIILSANTALLAIVGVLAGQPPSLTPGQTYNIVTPKGEPNYEATVAPPPAPTRPVVDPGA